MRRLTIDDDYMMLLHTPRMGVISYVGGFGHGAMFDGLYGFKHTPTRVALAE